MSEGQSCSSDQPNQMVEQKDVRDVFASVLVQNQKDLIFLEGTMSKPTQFETPQPICPLKECLSDFKTVEELKTHLRYGCKQFVWSDEEMEDELITQTMEYVEMAKKIQDEGTFIKKKVKSNIKSKLILKCQINSPLATYLIGEKFDVYDDQPAPDKKMNRNLLRVEFEQHNCTLFFDFSNAMENVEDKRLNDDHEEDDDDNEEGNPWSDHVFKGFLAKKVDWNQKLTGTESKTVPHTTFVAVITAPAKTPVFGDRLKVVRQFECQVPATCVEAMKAVNLGSSRAYRVAIPGIPRVKFNETNMSDYGPKAGEVDKHWNVQRLYEVNGDESHCTILYEGWENRQIADLEDTVDELLVAPILKASRIRASILAEFEMWGSEEMKRFAIRQRYIDEENAPQGQLFWILEDMSYFHTKLQAEQHLGPVIYIALAEDIEPPNFSYSPINVASIITYTAYTDVKDQPAVNYTTPIDSKTFDRSHFQVDRRGGGCEKKETCFCYTKYNFLVNSGGRYKHSQHLRFLPSGCLDLSQYKEDRERVVVECSNICECSDKCPRRALQRGQQKPIVVFYEGCDEGFGLRAGASFETGEFIGEITGMLCRSGAHQVRFEFLDNRFGIDFTNTGNCFRFLHNSKNSNATLVEIFSRSNETDAILPRMGVFATRDIAFGEKITVPVSRAYQR